MLLRVMRRADYSDSSDEDMEPSTDPREMEKIQLKEWIHSVSHGQSHNNDYTKRLVLNFLLDEGYFDIAETFSKEANIGLAEWTSEKEVRHRCEIKNLIKSGEIDQALEEIKTIDPGFCENKETNHEYFMLKCLKVINQIKNNEFEAAIKTAKEQLLPFSDKNSKYLSDIEKVMSLIAFVNVKDCPNSELASHDHGNSVANMVNKHLITVKSKTSDESDEHGQSLQIILKMGKWCEKQLSQYLKFPKLNLYGSQELFIEEK